MIRYICDCESVCTISKSHKSEAFYYDSVTRESSAVEPENRKIDNESNKEPTIAKTAT